MKKTAIVSMALVISGLILLAVAGISQVSAQTTEAQPPQQEMSRRGGNWFDSLIQKLVEKFSLNKDEVQVVFDEVHEQKQAEMNQRFNEQLNEAVQQGELTEEQKNLIIQKKEEMQKQREEEKDISKEELETLREQHRTEMEQWAEDNGIDMKYLMGGRGPGKGPGMGEGRQGPQGQQQQTEN